MIKRVKKNHTVLCTSRDYQQVTQLAKIRGLKLIIIGKHGGAIRELGNEKLDEKKLYNAGTYQIVGSALNICPESIPKDIKNDYEKKLKQLVKQSKK